MDGCKMSLFKKKDKLTIKNTIKKINAQVLLARCKKSKQLYGITIEQVSGNAWEMKYSYFIDEVRAKSEGFDKSIITADCYAADIYPGCPNCGSTGYVKCSYCGKLTCWENEGSLRCSWCGKQMNNIAYRGAMDISAGMD